MSIKRRLEAMEREAGGPDPLIVFFKTFFEGKDGSVESQIWSASVVDGPYGGTQIKRQGNETFEEFQARCYAVTKGEISTAEQTINAATQAQFSPVISMKSKGSRVESTMEKGQINER